MPRKGYANVIAFPHKTTAAQRELISEGFLTVHEAHLISGLSEKYIYQLALADVLPSAKIGRAVRISRKGLMDFLASRLR